MVNPHSESNESDADGRHNQRHVSEDVPAGEAGHEGRYDRRPGKKDDVNVRVSEKPEQMLIQENVAAFSRVEELRSHRAVQEQHAAGEHHRRHGEDHHEGEYELLPQDHRHAIQRHSGSAMFKDRCRQTHRRCERRRLREGDHLRPEIDALARRIIRPRERDVGKPSTIGADVQQQSHPEENAAE